MADGLELRDALGTGGQQRQRPEGQTPEVGVEARTDDANAVVGEPHRDLDNALVEELHLVDANRVVADGEPGDVG